VKFVDAKASIKLRMPMEGRKNFVGLLKGFVDGNVSIEVEGMMFAIPFNNIEKARLVPEF
jgi:ribosome maturation factor RimP